MDICVIGIVKRKKEESSYHWNSGSDVDLQLYTVYQTPGTKALLLQFSLFSQQRAAAPALCLTLPRLKHTWERGGRGRAPTALNSGFGSGRFPVCVWRHRLGFPWIKLHCREGRSTCRSTEGHEHQRGSPPLLQEKQTTDSTARLDILQKLVVSLTFSSFSTCNFGF